MARRADFESSVGVDDKPKLFTIEAGWQFTENWSLRLQHFSSERSGSRIIDETIEWQDLLFNVGAGSEYRCVVSIFVLSKHFGVGLTYQFFQIDATVKDTNWIGDVRARFTGPNLLISGYWKARLERLTNAKIEFGSVVSDGDIGGKTNAMFL